MPYRGYLMVETSKLCPYVCRKGVEALILLCVSFLTQDLSSSVLLRTADPCHLRGLRS